MRIFGIKKGSWYNIKKKYNLDIYSEKTIENNQEKFLYNQEAYNILKENHTSKIIEEVRENPKMLSLIQENETLKATLAKYENLSNKFEKMYEEEKESRLKEIEKANERQIKITELQSENKRIQNNWQVAININSSNDKKMEEFNNLPFWKKIFYKF